MQTLTIVGAAPSGTATPCLNARLSETGQLPQLLTHTIGTNGIIIIIISIYFEGLSTDTLLKLQFSSVFLLALQIKAGQANICIRQPTLHYTNMCLLLEVKRHCTTSII